MNILFGLRLRLAPAFAPVVAAVLAVFLLLTTSAHAASDRSLGAEAQRYLQVASEANSVLKFREALDAANHALSISRRIKDPEGESAALVVLGSIYLTARDGDRARDAFQKMLVIASARGNEVAVGSAYANIGFAFKREGRCAEAVDAYRVAREKYRTVKPAAFGSVSFSMASCLQSLGELAEAGRLLEEGLAACRSAADRECLSVGLMNRSSLNRVQSRFQAALDDLDEGSRLQEPGASARSRAGVASRRATLYYLQGRYFDALKACDEARELYVSNGYDPEEGIALYNLYANIYSSLGRNDDTFRYRQDALRAARALRVPSLLNTVLYNVGDDYLRREQYDLALKSWDEAAQVYPDAAWEADLGRASVAYRQGRYQEAVEGYRRALEAGRAREGKPGELIALLNLGASYNKLRDFEKARGFLQEAVRIVDLSGVPRYAPYAELARSLAGLGRLDEAIYFGKQAVNAAQTVRSNSSQLDTESQRSLVSADMRRAYEDLATMLLDRGRTREAQEVLILLKAQEYFGFLHLEPDAEDSSPQAPANGVKLFTEIELEAAKKKALDMDAVTIGREYRRLATIPVAARTAEQKSRYAFLQKQLDDAQARYRNYLEETGAAFRRAGRAEISANVLSDSEGLQSSLEKLGKGVVLVQYLLTLDDVRILLTTPDVQVARTSAVSASEVRRMVDEYRKVLSSSQQDPLPLARRLYEALVTPVAADLEKAHATMLMVSLDGVLQYLPLAALHDGKSWLIERYALATYLPAARGNIDERRRADWRVAAMGVSKASLGAGALPGVPLELHSIVREASAPGRGVLPGRISLDEQFTDQTLRSALEEQFPVIHIATHFLFTPHSGADSFLLLGGGARLSLSDFQRKAFRLTAVDLITLSACQTAVGDDPASGSEVEGLAVTLVRRGAHSVIASLWSVSDASTAQLMSSFYQLRQTRNVDKAQALRQAQIAMIRGAKGNDAGDRGVEIDKPSPAGRPRSFTHPFYWAPFVLMGNWQ